MPNPPAGAMVTQVFHLKVTRQFVSVLMSQSLLLSVTALLTLIPAAFWSSRFEAVENAAMVMWLLGAALTGTLSWAAISLLMLGGWQTDLGSALRISVAAGMIVFTIGALMDEAVRRLTRLFTLLMLVMTVLAVLVGLGPGEADRGATPGSALWAHITVSVATYAFLAVAATAALGASIQERALKNRSAPGGMSSTLPSVLDCESVVQRYLFWAWAVLGGGIITGLAVNLGRGDAPVTLDHKTVFAIGAFVVIGLLILARRISGVRGRRAARWVLAAYLLLTLAYPGVKFVTQVVLS